MKTYFFLLAFLAFQPLFGQIDSIEFENPSFEGNPLEGGLGNSDLPRGWTDCGFRGETAPDIHPVYGGQFNVSKIPAEGRTYIGMVVRDNDTWERIGQRLESPLLTKHCYSFTIKVAQSELYLSKSRRTDKPTNYIEPCILRVKGGRELCSSEEVLAVSDIITNKEWTTIEFTFSPQAKIRYITLEAFYQTPTLFPYNGNVLIDDLSPIYVHDCNSLSKDSFERSPANAIVLEYDEISETNTDVPKKEDLSQQEAPIEEIPKVEKKEIKQLDKKEIEILLKGLTTNALFEGGSNRLSPKGKTNLKELFQYLKDGDFTTITIAFNKNTGDAVIKERDKILESLQEEVGADNLLLSLGNKTEFEYFSKWTVESDEISIYYSFD